MTDDQQTQSIDDVLTAALAASADRRNLRARTCLTTLRRYERRILRDAAVMGFVRGYDLGWVHGTQEARGERPYRSLAGFPADADIIVDTINACDRADGYDYITDACNGRRRRVTKARLYHPEEPR